MKPPRDTKYPFLLHRTKDKRSVATLCVKCAEDQAISSCNHNDIDRFIRGTFTTVEINYAISLGYKVHYIFECWHWDSQELIFKKMMQLLMKKKVMYSGFPADCITQHDKQSYCDAVNRKLELDEENKLTVPNICEDPARKKYYKLLSCSVLGKMGQSNIFPEDLYIQNPSQLEPLLDSTAGVISDIELINPDVLYCRFQRNKNNYTPNRSGNCAVAAFITAYARVKMHKAVMSLVNQSDIKVYSVEADAVAFSKRVGTSLPVRTGSQIGDFRIEYNEIMHYSSLGAKTSCVHYVQNSEIKSIVKVKGLNLKGKLASNSVNLDTYAKQVSDLVKGIKSHIKVPQSRQYTKFSTCTSRMTMKEFIFSNFILKNRKLLRLENGSISYYPYGYKE